MTVRWYSASGVVLGQREFAPTNCLAYKVAKYKSKMGFARVQGKRSLTWYWRGERAWFNERFDRLTAGMKGRWIWVRRVCE